MQTQRLAGTKTGQPHSSLGELQTVPLLMAQFIIRDNMTERARPHLKILILSVFYGQYFPNLLRTDSYFLAQASNCHIPWPLL